MIRTRTLFLALGLAMPGVAGAQQPTSPPATSLSLIEALAAGREHGVNAVLAQLNVEAAGRRIAQRRADLLPNIAATGSWTRQTLNLDEFGLAFASGVTDPFNIYSLQVRAYQTLFDASVISRLRAATDSAAAAGYDARSVGELSAATAGLAYLRVLGAEETVRAREADSVVAAQLLGDARKQYDAGVSPVIDVTRNEVGLAAVRTQLVIARNQAARARLDLARALDLPPEMPLVLTSSLETPELEIPATPAEGVAFALAHRPEMLAEQQRTRGLTRAVRAIWDENLPSLALGGGYKWSGRTTNDLNGSYQVQLQLSVPILDGFRRQNRYREGRIRLEQQQIHQQDVERQISTEVRQATLDLSSAAEQVELAGSRLGLAEQELSQANERFRAGVAGSVETTSAQTAVIDARNSLIQARVALGSARISAYRALGVLDEVK